MGEKFQFMNMVNSPELLKGFKKVNPNCKIVSISIQGYGSEMFYRGSNILNIAGWSESIFDVINASSADIRI